MSVILPQRRRDAETETANKEADGKDCLGFQRFLSDSAAQRLIPI
jgi:hypothetical protein